MCTAATYQTKNFYFGRTLDYEFGYGEEVTITPRRYPFDRRHGEGFITRYALIGMAYVAGTYPLYYDAVNEKGLGMAGLNFVGNAVYPDAASVSEEKEAITQFELIPWILGQCSSVKEARSLLESLRIVNTSFSPQLPSSQLHWILADKQEAITVESVKEGLKIYENPVGVLTNNPPFDVQMFLLNQYQRLSPAQPHNDFCKELNLELYSRGMGALGLPGDLSSPSRFVRAAFTKLNSISGDSEAESVSQFFHILGSVDQPRGCCEVTPGRYEITLYTSCANADRGIYYYTTYDNHQITAVDIHQENLEASVLIRYPLIRQEQIHLQNEKKDMG